MRGTAIIMVFLSLLAGLAFLSPMGQIVFERGGIYDNFMSIVRGGCIYRASGDPDYQNPRTNQNRPVKDAVVRIPPGFQIIDHDIMIPGGTRLPYADIASSLIAIDGGGIDSPRRANPPSPGYHVYYIRQRGVNWVVYLQNRTNPNFALHRVHRCATWYNNPPSEQRIDYTEHARSNNAIAYTPVTVEPFLRFNPFAGFMVNVIQFFPLLAALSVFAYVLRFVWKKLRGGGRSKVPGMK